MKQKKKKQILRAGKALSWKIYKLPCPWLSVCVCIDGCVVLVLCLLYQGPTPRQTAWRIDVLEPSALSRPLTNGALHTPCSLDGREQGNDVPKIGWDLVPGEVDCRNREARAGQKLISGCRPEQQSVRKGSFQLVFY